MRVFTTASTATILSCLALQAQAQTSTALQGDPGGAVAANAVSEVVVVANRTPTELDKVGQSVTVLTLPQIRADQETVISDILARTPGVSFSRNGGPGETTSLRIRGAETDQTVVLIDGVKLNDPASTGGGYNFADLITGDIARIEVLRGPQSTLYGSQAIGGVVNIVTAEPTKPFQGDAQVEGGSYGTGYAKAGLGGVDGRWTWRGAVSAYTTDGISAFDRNVFNAAGQRVRGAVGGREPDGYHNTAVTGRLGYQLTDAASVDLRAYYAEARNKIDGFATATGAFGDDLEFGRTQQFVGYAGLNLSTFGDRLKNRFAIQDTQNDRQNLNPNQANTPLTFDASGINHRAEYQGVLQIAKGYTAVFGAEHEHSDFSTASPSAGAPRPAPTKAGVDINSGYGQLQAEVSPGLNITGGLRYDDHETFGGHVTGQVAAAWSLFGGGTVLRASYGEGFKAPTLYQLYSLYGNLTLNPEEGEGWDAGVTQRFWGGKAEVSATYFGRDTKNLITFVSCPSAVALRTGRCVTQPFGYYNNVAKTEADGVELAGSVRPLAGLEMTANYTFTDPRDRSPGAATFDKLLARRPQETANLGATYRFPLDISAGVAVRYAGRSFDNAVNTTRLKGYTLVDLRASVPLPHGLELYGRVENLFDRDYETVFRYGSLGRAGYVGVRATF